jgi:hypothetical protein
VAHERRARTAALPKPELGARWSRERRLVHRSDRRLNSRDVDAVMMPPTPEGCLNLSHGLRDIAALLLCVLSQITSLNAWADAALRIGLTGSIAPGRPAEMRAEVARSAKAIRSIHRDTERQAVNAPRTVISCRPLEDHSHSEDGRICMPSILIMRSGD